MRSVRFTTTRDGLSLAWTRSGSGPPLVKPANWLTHLQYDAEGPLWSHWVRFLEENFDYVRYDERGCGLSDRRTGELSVENWTDDLERVVAASHLPKPFAILAMSQGTMAAIEYAVRHPEDVSHLIILGGYARGTARREDRQAAALNESVINVFENGFDEANPAFREVFTRRFIPNGDAEKIMWFNDLCQRTTTATIGAALLRARTEADVTAALGHVSVPVLVLHARDDGVVPVSEGALIAQSVEGAEFRVLESSNHILQADEPAWDDFRVAMLSFIGANGSVHDLGLTARETEILRLICAAKSNKDIARDLNVSEKTVRNHATNLFAKLGVKTRQEAILKTGKR